MAISRLYREDRQKAESYSDQVVSLINQISEIQVLESTISSDVFDKAYGEWKSSYDPGYGGFGGAPKFPQAMACSFLMRYWRRSGESQALNMVERGGTVLFFAPTAFGVEIPVSINDLFFRNDITLTTSYGSAPNDSWMALELIRSDRVNVKDMITHRLPLEKTVQGFEIVAQAEDSMKVIIEPQK